MREIKFRVYDPTKGRFIHAPDVKDAYHVEVIPTTSGFKLYSRKELKNEIMQFTGLKDKNGVDIYEGDIVFLKNGIVNPYTISWHWQGASFCMKNKAGASPGLYDHDYEDYEVIGNIYENPELLKGPTNE